MANHCPPGSTQSMEDPVSKICGRIFLEALVVDDETKISVKSDVFSGKDLKLYYDKMAQC